MAAAADDAVPAAVFGLVQGIVGAAHQGFGYLFGVVRFCVAWHIGGDADGYRDVQFFFPAVDLQGLDSAADAFGNIDCDGVVDIGQQGNELLAAITGQYVVVANCSRTVLATSAST